MNAPVGAVINTMYPDTHHEHHLLKKYEGARSSPSIATKAAPMMNGALSLAFADSHTVPQIDRAAIAFGGTVMLFDR